MSDTTEPISDDKNKGFHIDKKGFHCIPCRCKRQLYHKETKTVNENDKITTNTVVDKRNLKFGGGMLHLMKYLELMRETKRDQLQYVTLDGANHK